MLGSTAFETRSLVASGLPDVAAALALDLDGDGNVDLVAVAADGAAAVSLGQGSGTFAVGRRLQLPADPAGLRAADLDGDGDDDLVVVGRVLGETQVLRNLGDGDLQPVGAAFLVGANVSDFTLGDVDGDDLVDLVSSHSGRSGFTVHAGLGDATFLGPRTIVATHADLVTGMATGDFDGDGRRDLAFCDVDRGAACLLLGDQSGMPGNQVDVTVGAAPVALDAADLDGDGLAEIVVANALDESLSVLHHQGGTAFQVIQTVAVDGQPAWLTLGDLDGDGQPEACVGVLDHRALAIFRGVPGGFDAEVEQSACSGSPLRPMLTDIDADGDLDCLVPALGLPDLNLYRSESGRLLAGRLHRIDGVRRPEVVGAADFDGDGRMDVASGSFNEPVLRFLRAETDALGALEFGEIGSFDFGSNVQNVVTGDLDRDGRTDLLVALAGGVKVLANRSQGGNLAFELIPSDPNRFLAAGVGPFEMVAADFDADGAVDVAAAYHASNLVVVVPGIPGATLAFGDPVELMVPDRPAGIAVGDFDGDGQLELAVSRIDAATVSVLEVAGGLERVFDAPVGALPNYLRSADFDSDGRDDLVVSDGGSDSLTILRGAAGAQLQSMTLPAGRLPTALLTRDLNRDGHADVLVASMVGADFRVLLGDGLGGFSQALVFPGVYTAVTAAFGDLDGDGLEDLLIGSLFSQRLATFLNRSE